MFWQIQSKLRKQKFFTSLKSKNNFNRVILKNYLINYTKFNKLVNLSIYNNQVISKNSFYRKYKNYCLITGKSKSVFRFCMLSRMQIKKFMNLGLFIGVRKFN